MKTLNESDRIAAGLMKLRAEGPFVVALDLSGSSQRDVVRWASHDIAAGLLAVGQRAATFFTFSETVMGEEPNVPLELLLDVALDRLFDAASPGGTRLEPVFWRAREIKAKSVIVFSDCEFTPGDGQRSVGKLRVLFVKYPNVQATGSEIGLTIPYMR